MLKTSQHGFTLIELVVVIVILGILAAFAVPRFMGMENEARAAQVKSLGGSLQAAATMARAKCQAQGCGAAGTVQVDGRNVTMANGWPNRGTIQNALQGVEGFQAANNGTTGRRFTKIGGGPNCWVQYDNAVAPDAPVVSYGVAGTPGTVAFNRNLANDC